MSHGKGQVRFCDGSIKYFEYDGTADICRPKLYNTFDEMINNWRKPYISTEINNSTYNKKTWLKKIFKTNKDNKEQVICNHSEEQVDIYTDYGGGFYWKGTACKKM